MLTLDQVHAGYGQAVVLENIGFHLAAGESLALLGRNGVGKSTLMATLMGATRLHRGSIRFQGRELTAMAPHRRAAAGLGWVAQERGIFASLSVRENLCVAARPGEWNLHRVYELFPRLAERERHLGSQLSGGEQQMLAIARALMLNPKLLLLDEPLEGLAPVLAEQLTQAIRALTENAGLTIILVEQHARQALALTQRAIVMDRGRISYDGTSAELLRDPALLDRMIGVRR